MITTLRKTRPAQRLLRHLRPWTKLRPDWRRLLGPDWEAARMAARGGPRVLIATGTGSNWPCSTVEGLLGVALTLRGAQVRFLLCDGILPACQECDRQWLSESTFVARGPAPLCGACHPPALAMLAPLGLPVLRYGQFLDPAAPADSREDLEEHARAGALRYFGRGTLPDGRTGQAILDRYRRAAATTAAILDRLVREQRPDVAVFHHGIYVPQGVVGQVLRRQGVRVVNWGPAYRKRTLLFSHGNTYHHTMIDESPDQWLERPWDAAREARLMDYLGSRWTGGNDWISFQTGAGADPDARAIARRLDLDLGRPVIGLLTNVIWDAQLHFRQAAFPSMLDWLFASVEHFLTTPERQLVIRVHPAEVLGSVPSRQRAADELARRFGPLPPHIKVVGPENPVSTYALMTLCNSVLAYGTKTALELACTGLPVVVAGEAWCRGKGFTLDVSSPEEYARLIARLPLPDRLTPEQVQAARQYAYHFFFRRMIPLASLDPQTPFGPYRVRVADLADLLPGRDPGLDLVCNGILDGRPFVYEPPDHGQP